MSNIPVWAMGYALRAAGVPCAEEIAMMLGRQPQHEGEPYGYIYDGMVLPKAVWDDETYPYGAVLHTPSVWESTPQVLLCVSAEPIYCNRNNNAVLPSLHCISEYNRAANSWGEFSEPDESTYTPRQNVVLWTNQDIVRNTDGATVYRRTKPKAFYLNDAKTPTAFLYDTGRIVFQADSVPDANRTIVGAYVGWDKAQYTAQTDVPWNRIDTSRIGSVKINEDVVPAYTDHWFRTCKNLATADLHNGLAEIGASMFRGAGLNRITIPEGIVKIGDYAYAECNAVDSMTYYTLVIPENVEHIGDYAFSGVNPLISSLQVNAAYIGDHAFADKTQTFNITVGAGVRKIAPYAFHRCGFSVRPGGTTMKDFHTSITFENAEGWSIGEDAEATSGTAVDVTNATENALNLAGVNQWNGSYTNSTHTEIEGVYANYYWNRTE